MGIKWNNLTSTDPKAAWKLSSVEIAKDLFQSKMKVVPRMEDAEFFDLWVCFSNARKPKSKNFLSQASYDIAFNFLVVTNGQWAETMKKIS